VANSHYSITKNATFSGAGSLTWTGDQNFEGTINLGIGPFAETYVIAADGTLTITNAGVPVTLSGGVLSGGAVAVAGSITPGGIMEIRVYIRN
jgi:hypothetical protein